MSSASEHENREYYDIGGGAIRVGSESRISSRTELNIATVPEWLLEGSNFVARFFEYTGGKRR